MASPGSRGPCAPHQHNVCFRKGNVLGLGHYDHLIIAAGGAANSFDIPGAAVSTPLHPLARPWEARDKILAKLEEAVMNEQQRHLRILVVAGGATGVETADALAEAAEQRHADDLTKLPLARTCHP